MENNRSSRKQRKSNYNNSSPSWLKWFKRILLGVFLFIVLIIVGGCSLFAFYAASSPEMTQEDLYGSYASDVVDKDGEIVYTLGGENREHATFEEYPEALTNAVMAIEDQRFLDHSGFDPIGIGRAAVGYVTEGKIVGGGSTITQQLIKLSVFSTTKDDQNLRRKAQEVWLAIQLEQDISKEDIMTLYLNKVHMGGNVYGMATAAQEYYDKHVSELELHEAALLAGMPKAPNYYNPYKDPEAAKNRRDTVLYAMVDFGAITKEKAYEASQIPIDEGLIEPKDLDEDSLVFDGYLTAVIKEVREKTDLDPYTAGLTIHTNLDPDKQQKLFDIVHNQSNTQIQDDELQTAITLINNETGAIDAIIGSRHIEGHLSENFATNMERNVGSTIKPLTTYGPAIEYLDYSTYQQVYDEKYTVEGTDWEPRNWDREYHGQMSLRQALVNSRNIPTAKLFNEDLKMDQVEEFLINIGVDPQMVATGSNSLVPSNAIDGTMSPLNLAGAYSAFARNGQFTDPYTVESIVTNEGEEINLQPETNQAIKDSTAYMTTDILKDVVTEVYDSELSIPNVNQAGKTGTTNYSDDHHEQYNIPKDGVPDSWYVGYTKEYTMSTWVGYENQFNEGHYLTNQAGTRQLPRTIHKEMFSKIYEEIESQDWEKPDSVVELDIVDGSDPAEIANEHTPDSAIVKELFVKGNEPDTRSTGFFNRSKEEDDDQTEDEEPEESEDTELAAPSGLTASYNEDDNKIIISWTPLSEEASYLVSVNGNQTTVSESNYTVTNSSPGTVVISVAGQKDNQTGPASTISLTVPGSIKEDEKEPDKDENEETEQTPDNEDDTDANQEVDTEEDEDSESDDDQESDQDTKPEEQENANESEDQKDDDNTTENDENA